jgi:hypothetical protein
VDPDDYQVKRKHPDLDFSSKTNPMIRRKEVDY